MLRRTLSHFIVIGLVLAMAGCASKSPDNDPFEGYNRAMTKFNLGVDDKVMVPVATGYTKVFPRFLRDGIGNALRNLGEPYVMVNDLLQFKPIAATADLSRFVINSTIGIAGLFDVASAFGIERNSEDFGQTLAVWGVPSGPHLVLPFLGPSNIRDAFGVGVSLVYGTPIEPEDEDEAIALRVVNVIDTRSRFLGTEELLKLQPSPYLFLREGYRQRRESAIHDGAIPDEGTSDDDLLDELFDEEEPDDS